MMIINILKETISSLEESYFTYQDKRLEFFLIQNFGESEM